MNLNIKLYILLLGCVPCTQMYPFSLSVLANERPQNVLEKTLKNQKQL